VQGDRYPERLEQATTSTSAYRAKYHRDSERIVGSIVSPNARAATLKLVPR
jgi:hypothetical protein